MTQDEIIEMARQAGFMMENSAAIQAAEIFAKLVADSPQRTWVGLTDEEAMQICVDCGCMSEDWLTLLDAIEAKLKEKNT